MSVQEKTMIPACLIDADMISDSPGPYCMSFGFELGLYSHSIKEIGLVNTPLLIKNTDGGIDVISGYRRIQGIKTLKWDKIPCRILPESTLSALECLLLNLHDNLSTRRLNIVEKGMLLNRLIKHLPVPEIVKHYMPLLDLPSHEETLRFYIRIEEELDVKMKKYLALERLTLQSAKMLLEVNPESRSSLCSLISYLKLNSNQQKQLIDYIIDISHISGTPVSDLINRGPIEKICSDQNLNTPQKGRAMLRFLRGIRLPTLETAESNFKEMVSRLDLPDGVRIKSPRFFEDPYYQLEVSFREGKELKEKIESLSCKEGLRNLGNPWEKISNA
jgi:ParB family chromosome partitioning protein